MAEYNHEQLRRLFDLASAAAPGDRGPLLDRECRGDTGLRNRIEAMIAAAEDDRFLSEPTPGHGDDSPTADSSPAAATIAAPIREGAGTRIGPYKLLQLIGEGGFGSVFLAEQEKPVSRKVALKIIKLGMDTRQVVARFEQERQALAILDHPHIAKVFDAGATETGRPYFVMELVKGEPLSEYADKHNLSIEERLELFAQVCQAVQHAHTKGIIHRDLKPGNVLVASQDGKPSAKVIDFGIAKATASRMTERTLFTEHRQIIGTPEYMSPEQAEGSLDIDTRTDVYALGVMLYELLTGSTPFSSKELRSAAFAEIQRIIREVDPPKPSARLTQNADTLASVASRRKTEPRKLGTVVRGELDWIVMKALEKDRARRYETANGLAADIRRYLAGEAVVAAPPSAAYRFKKFVKRNRVMVTAGGATGVALLTVSVVTVVAAYRLNQQKQELAREKSISDQRLETYRSTVSQLVNRAPKLLEHAPVGAGTRQEFLTLLGSALEQSGDTAAVGPSRQYGLAAVAIREGELALSQGFADAEQSDRSEISSEQLKTAAERLLEAERMFREVYDSRPEDMSKAAANLAIAVGRRAVVLHLQGRPLSEVVPMYKMSIELRRESLAAARQSDSETIAQRKAELGAELHRYASFLYDNRSGDAARFVARALALATESCGVLREAIALQPASGDASADARRDMGLSLRIQALCAVVLGRFEEADRCFAEAVDVAQKLSADYPNRYNDRARLVEAANEYGDFLLSRNAEAQRIAGQYSIAMKALMTTLGDPGLRTLENGPHGLAMQYYRLGLVESLRGNRAVSMEHFRRCALIRELAWNDSLDRLNGDGNSDRLVTPRIELMLAQARSGAYEPATAHAQWLFERALRAADDNPGTEVKRVGGFELSELFKFAAAGFGLISEHVPSGERATIINRAIESTSRAIQSGYRDSHNLLHDPDFVPLQSIQEFKDLVATITRADAAEKK